MVDIEKEILEKLMYNPSLNYNSLWDKKKYPSSKFNYHRYSHQIELFLQGY